MPTTKGTKTKSKDVRKRAERVDLDRLVEIATEKHEDGSYPSHQEMADKMGVARVTITRALQRVPEWQLKERDINQFKQDRADIFAAAQQLILKHVTEQKLKAASLQQLGTLFGIFYDKERLERGQATTHVAEVTYHKLDPDTQKFIEKAIQARTKAELKRVGNDNN